MTEYTVTLRAEVTANNEVAAAIQASQQFSDQLQKLFGVYPALFEVQGPYVDVIVDGGKWNAYVDGRGICGDCGCEISDPDEGCDTCNDYITRLGVWSDE